MLKVGEKTEIETLLHNQAEDPDYSDDTTPLLNILSPKSLEANAQAEIIIPHRSRAQRIAIRILKWASMVTVLLAVVLAAGGLWTYHRVVPEMIKDRFQNPGSPEIHNVTILSVDNDTVRVDASFTISLDSGNIEMPQLDVAVEDSTWTIIAPLWPNGTVRDPAVPIAAVSVAAFNMTTASKIDFNLSLNVTDFDPAYIKESMNANRSSLVISVICKGNLSLSVFNGKVRWTIPLEPEWTFDKLNEKQSWTLDDFNFTLVGFETSFFKGVSQAAGFQPIVDVTIQYNNPTFLIFNNLVNVTCDIAYEDVLISSATISNFQLVTTVNNTAHVSASMSKTRAALLKIRRLASKYYNYEKVPIEIRNIHVWSHGSTIRWLEAPLLGFTKTAIIPSRKRDQK